MLDFLLEHQRLISLAAGITGFLSIVYKIFVSAPLQRRNHDALTRLIAWAARGGWLDALQAGVRWVLRVMSLVYGSPNDDARSWPRRYMTLRAWRMSAWIASFYVLVLGPVALVIWVIAREIHGANPRSEGSIWVGGFIALIALGSFAVHGRLLPAVRNAGSGEGIRDKFDYFFRGAAIGLVATVALVAVFGAIFWVLHPTSATSAASIPLVLCLAAMVVLIAFALLRSIARFGFYAPLVLMVQLAFAALLSFQLFAGAFVFAGLLGMLKPGAFQTLGWPVLIALGVACIMTLTFLVLAIMRKRPWNLAYVALAIAIIAASIEAFLAGQFPTSNRPVVGGIVLIAVNVGLSLGQYLLIFYGLIFANSFPDWVAVGLTRLILHKASQARSIWEFAVWLVVDFASAAFCLILSNVILTLAMGAAYIADLLLETAYLTKKPTESSDLLQFFADGAGILQVLYILLLHGPAAAGTKVVDLWIHSDGFKAMLALSLIGCAALMPTALNALTLIAFIAARFAASVIAPPFRALHGLFLIRENATTEEIAISYARSTFVFALVGATTIIILAWVVDLLR